MTDNDKGRGVLKNVAMYYTAIQTPKNKYQSELRQYSVTIVLDKAQATAFSKEFPKKKVNPISNDEFIEKYKSDVPFPESPIQYVFSLSQDELKKDGTPMPDFLRPRALLEDKSGQIYDITETHLIGNGSRGDVHYSWYTTSFGKTVRLSNIVVKQLVKYERPPSDFIDLNTVKTLPSDFDIDSVAVPQTEGKDTVSVGSPSPKTEASKEAVTPSPAVVDENLPF